MGPSERRRGESGRFQKYCGRSLRWSRPAPRLRHSKSIETSAKVLHSRTVSKNSINFQGDSRCFAGPEAGAPTFAEVSFIGLLDVASNLKHVAIMFVSS